MVNRQFMGLGSILFVVEENVGWRTIRIVQQVIGLEAMRAMAAPRPSPDTDVDLNVLVPAFYAANPEQRRKALAVLQGQMAEDDTSAGEEEERTGE